MKGRPTPPRLASALLRWLPLPGREFVLGDLQEEYASVVLPERGRLRADLWFWSQALRSILSLGHAGLAETVRSAADWVRTDVRYGVRQLRRAPLTSAVAVLTLALGLAVTVSAVAVVDTAYFEPLPVPDPEEIHAVYTGNTFGGEPRPFGRTSYPDFLDYRASGSLGEIAAHWVRALAVSSGDFGPAERSVQFVSPDYFDVLRVDPVRGRALASDGATAGVVISHHAWQRDLGGDPDVLGRQVWIRGRTFPIVGIAPAGFRGTVDQETDVFAWAPLDPLPDLLNLSDLLTSRDLRNFSVVARLPAGVDDESMRERANALAGRLARAFPESRTAQDGRPHGITVRPWDGFATSPTARGETYAVLGGLGLLLMLLLAVVCTNVAGLLTARALERSHEMAVRQSLGASRIRLSRQLLSESLILALFAGGLGLLCAKWLLGIGAVYLPASLDLAVDGRVMVAGLAITVGCALAFGLAPVAQSLRGDLRSSFSGTYRRSGRRSRLLSVVIAVQVAASVCLLALGVSSLRGLRSVEDAPTGFDTDGLLVASLHWSGLRYSTDTLRSANYIERLRGALAESPGVESFSAVERPPLSDLHSDHEWKVVDRSSSPPLEAIQTHVGPDYIRTMGIPLLRGRLPRRGALPEVACVGVVNRAFIDRYGPGIVGRVLEWRACSVEVVGVVDNARSYLAEDGSEPHLYWTSHPGRPMSTMSTSAFVIRVAPGSENVMARTLVRRLAERTPDFAPPTIQPLDDFVGTRTRPQQTISRIALWIGGVELVLAAAGLYALLLHVLARRRHEIGVRLALGAGVAEAGWTVARRALRSTIAGVVLGVGAGGAMLTVAAPFVIGSAPADFVPYVIAASTVMLVVAAASVSPALRAGRVQPAAELRAD